MAIPGSLFLAGAVAYAFPVTLPLMWWVGGGIAAGIAVAFSGVGARGKAGWQTVAVWGLAVLWAALIRDTSWDGLSKHQESVLALAAGWNPDKDPEGKTLAQLAEREPGLRGSWILERPDPPRIQHFLAALPVAAGFGVESAKWLGPLLLICAWGLVQQGLGALGWLGWRKHLVAAGFALNPVSLSQIPSLYFDGAYASALTAAVGACFLIWGRPGAAGWVGWIGALGLSVCLKRAGLVTAGCLAAFFLSAFLLRRGWRSLLQPTAWLSLLALGAAAFFAQFLLPPPMRPSPELFRMMLNPSIQDEGAGSNPELRTLPRWRQYAASHFAPTEVLPERIRSKPPFWFTRPELAVFEDLSPDPRAGGFGPLYLTACCLALVPGAVGLRRPHPSRNLWGILLVVVLVTLFLLPSWWARWFPQGWWAPALLACSTLAPDSVLGGRVMSKLLGWMTVGTMLANAVLVGAFTASGVWQAERLIRGQLRFLSQLPQPISVQLGELAGARRWLDQAGIRWGVEPEPGPATALRLHRSTVQIRLSSADLDRLGRDPALRQAWIRRNLLTPGTDQP